MTQAAATEQLMSDPVSPEPPQAGPADEQSQSNDCSDAPAVASGDDSDYPVEDDQYESQHGSSLGGATFNFANSIVGAGACGLGGAIAKSGGIISILTIVFFAFLTKLSLDLVIRLSVETAGAHGSYENLGRIAFGRKGRLVVVVSKFLYSFGCLVAYVVVVKDNLGSALLALFYGSRSASPEVLMGPSLFPASLSSHDMSVWFHGFLEKDAWVTWVVSTLVMLPLCCLRDMTPLASLSVISVASMVCIVCIVIYLYIFNPHEKILHPGGSFYNNWLEVRWGYLECLGTFVFTFVSQHTAHLAFGSLKPELRTVDNWRKVSSAAILLSGTVSLSVGGFVYASFWQATESDIFQIYPAIPVIDLAKLLLCITMLLTFPLPFFTCRELIIVTFFPSDPASGTTRLDEFPLSLQEPLLEEGIVEGEDNDEIADDDDAASNDADGDQSESMMDMSVLSAHAIALINSCLLPGEDTQLKLPYHLAMTGKLWVVVTGLAVAAPSLGDVLDLVGCATGTIIAFIFPACVAFRLEGYSYTSLLILVVGGVVGIVGTFFSLKQLASDLVPNI